MSSQDEPAIRIVAGNPTEQEIAAVVAVLSRRTRPVGSEADTSSGWAGYWRRARQPLRPGPDAWRRSLRR